MITTVAKLITLLVVSGLGSGTAIAGGPLPDADSDGINDYADNCLLVQNPLQRDTDGDGLGNYCDADFDNNGIVNLADLAVMKNVFFTSSPDQDMDGDTVVNFADLLLMKSGFFLPPGPGASQIAPSDIQLDNNSVDENQPAGTVVGTLSTTDLNPGDTHTYSFVVGGGDTDNSQFTIDGDTLKTAIPLNFEAADNCVTSASTCSIRVQTDDGNGGTYQESFIVNINDVNEAPEITSDGSGATATLSVAENQTAVTNVTATDIDLPAQNLTFSISGGADMAQFSIGAASGVLTFNSAPDFENPQDAGPNNVYDVQVKVTDDGAPNLSDIQDIAVTVTDVNENTAPTITSGAAVDAAENQTAVTIVTATDPEAPPQILTFSITGGADMALFSIGPASGVLTFNSARNFENPQDAGGNNVYDVQVTVTDDGAPSASDMQDIAVTVTNANDIPTDIALSNNSVDENEPIGTAVGTLSTTDEDTADSHTYSLVAGVGDTDNSQFSIAGNVLQTAAVLDYETASDCTTSATTCSIRVQSDDGNGGTYQEVFIININDTFDPNADPTDIALSNSSVNENQPVGTSVGNFSTTDADVSDSHTYTLVAGAGDTDNAQFSIVGSTLNTAAVLNFETATNCTTSASTCSIRVETNDGNGGTYQESFIINIGDVNDPPVGTDDSYSGAIGNTRLSLVAALSGTTPVPPTVELVGTLGDNDSDEDGDTVGAVAGTVATTQGGSVTIDANGRFVYSPPAGFTDGTDSFSYTPSDGVDSAATTSMVDIGLTNIVWYVDDSSPNNPGEGTSDEPFRNLSTAGGPSLPGEPIFVYSGTQTTGITLKNSQSLLGEGLALVINTTTLVDAGTRPDIANPAGTAVTLGNGNTVRGLNITGSVRGIVGTGFGTLTADNMAISTNGGAGIDLTSGAGSITFDSLSSSTSSTSGIDLDSVSGTFTLGSGSISGSTGPGIDITSSSATVSYGGTVAAGSNLAVNISGQTANSVSLSGNITSSGQGILLNNNTGGTINLSGGMSLSTGAFTAFSATNGGTVNVTGTNNAVTTTTATAVAIVGTTIGSSGVTFQSINSATAGSNVGIILDNTGSGTFTVAGAGGTCAVGTTTCTGGRIANKTGDAVTLNNTGGRVTLTAMLIEDIGSTTGSFNTRSQHDAIHGENVIGGLTLNNTLIRRVSDMCINGATFGGAFPGLGETTWNGLDILNSTIEDCNRFHVAGTGDTSDEGAVRIVGLTGTVLIDNSTIQRAGELMDLFTAPTGTLNMTVTNSDFIDSYKEFSPDVSGTSVIGKFCLDVTVEGSSDANVTIGGAGAFPNNEFVNCATASVRVGKDTVPAGNSNIDVIVNNNQFRVPDQTPANGIFGNTPQGGVLLRAGPGGITTYDGIVSNNVFGVSFGPDDRIGSTTDEIGNADGVPGNLALIFENGASQVRVNNNTFNGSLNAPWAHRADGNPSAKVLYVNNSYRGRDDYCCDGAFTFTVPGIPYVTNVRNGGALDITLRNDNFVHHDQFFFAQTETIEMNVQSSGGTLNVCLDNVTSGDGFEFDEDAGTLNLYQGAVNNAATGPCVVEADGHPVSACELEAADDGVRGGPSGHAQSSGPNPGLNPPHIDVDSGVITITGTACQEPSGGIF